MEQIRSTAERISIEDLSQRIELDGPNDEMKELSETFNSMIDRLEASFHKQNQFISDASHELKTPIAVIQGYANLMNRWGKDDPSVLQESLDSILAETEQMSTLIKKLLLLAKSDQSKVHIVKKPLSLNEVSEEILKELGILETKKNIVYNEEAEVVIFADYALVKQLIWIYVENSLKYTKENGTIAFRIYQDEQYGYISVTDDGIGIKEEDLPYIFDRFYRSDKSRNKEIAGTGLGLSIAKWIMDSHQGEILVESVYGQGTTFTSKFLLYSENSDKEGEGK